MKKGLPEGVNVCVSNGTNRPVEARGDGYLGDEIKTSILLQVSATPQKDLRVIGLVVQGNKNVIPAKDQNGNENGSGGKLYRITIPVKQNQRGESHTEYPENNIRLACLWSDGRLELWEVAVVSQNGKFFLTQQQTYAASCYSVGKKKEKKRLVCPSFEKRWPSLVAALNQAGSNNFIERLPSLPKSLPQPPKEGRSPVTRDNSGVVLWYNVAQGRGAMLTKYGQAAVHWTEVSRPGSSIKYLEANELVRYQGLRRPRQTKGRPSSFQREAVDVRPLPSLPA